MIKFALKASEVVDAVKILANIPYRKGIQCSEFVQLGFAKSAMTLRLASEMVGYAELRADVQAGKDVFHLDRGPLFPFLQSFETGADTIMVEIDGTRVKMKGGSRSATFTAAADVTAGYADTVLPDEQKIEWTEHQAGALSVLQHYVCIDALSPELTAVWVSPKKKGMFASNRLAIAGYWADEGLPYGGPFPSSLVPLMATAKAIYKGGGDTPGVRLSFGKTHLTQTMKVETANFPVGKVATNLSATVEPKIKVKAGALADVVGRLKLCSGDSIDQLDVHLSAKAGKLEVVTKTVSATLRESLKADVSGEHTADMLWGTLHPLIASLPPEATVNLGWEDGPYHVWAKDSIYILSAKKASK